MTVTAARWRDPVTGLTAAELAAYDLDVRELGQRVTDWLTQYQLATLYADEDDRTWEFILTMLSTFQPCGGIPPGWWPRIDAAGGWAPPWK